MISRIKISRPPSTFLACFALVALACFRTVTAAPPTPAWRLLKVAGRDYLTIENIAQFYQLKERPNTAGREAVFSDGRSSLAIGGNPLTIEINGVRHYLSFPVVEQDGETLISRFDLAKTIEPCLRPTMIAGLPQFHTVVLDAGHGGGDGGAQSLVGAEKDYTLDVIRDLKRSLEARGLKVLTTRDTDVYIPLEARAIRANAIADSIFVSVHFNASLKGDSASGLEVFAMSPQGVASTGDDSTSVEAFQRLPGNEDENASLALATCVHQSLLGHLPEIDRGVKRARFVVLKMTRAPSILVEGGFLTNPGESREIADGAWREKLAQAIAQGVESYQEVANRHLPPKLLADYRSEQLPLTGIIVNPAALAANLPRVELPILPVANPGLSPIHPPEVRAQPTPPPKPSAR